MEIKKYFPPTEVGLGLAGAFSPIKSIGGLGLNDRIASAAIAGLTRLRRGKELINSNQFFHASIFTNSATVSSFSLWLFTSVVSSSCDGSRLCSDLLRFRSLFAAASVISLIYYFHRYRADEICSWNVNKKDVKVFISDGCLYLNVLDKETKKTSSCLLEPKANVTPQKIRILKTLDAVIEKTNSCLFTKPFYREQLRTPDQDRQTCCLLKGDDGIVWQHHTTIGTQRITTQVPLSYILFDQRTPCKQKRVAEDSRNKLEQFRDRAMKGLCSTEDCIKLVENYKIEGFQKICSASSKGRKGAPESSTEEKSVLNRVQQVAGIKIDYLVRLSPILKSSLINEKCVLSPDQWLVTLVSTRRCITGDCGNHAEIVIEGFKERSYFFKVAHLRLPNEKEKIEGKKEVVVIDDFTKGGFKYYARTNIWRVASKKVEKMIQAIQSDIASPPRLNWLGSRSIFSKSGEESCFTWAKKKLEIIDVEIGGSCLDFLVSITNNKMTHYA